MAVLVVSLAVSWHPAFAADTTWTAGVGAWETVTNWTNGEPVSGSDAYVNNGGTVLVTQAGERCRYLYLGSQEATSGYVVMSSGSLAASLRAGYVGSGSFTLTGGTLGGGLSLGTYGIGTMTITGGQVNSSYPEIGGSGTGMVQQTGGTHRVALAWMSVGSESTGWGYYGLGGSGVLDASGKVVEVGCNGVGWVAQSGQSVATMGSLYMSLASNSTSRYDLTGGLLNSQTVRMHHLGSSGGAAFTQTGGSHHITGDLDMGAFEGYLSRQALALGTSSYELSGGTLQIDGAVTGAKGRSTLVLDGGLLDMSTGGSITVRSMTVARTTNATYRQEGSENVTVKSTVRLGQEAAARGSYQMQSTGLLDAGNLIVGDRGTGLFQQTSGSVKATRVRLGSWPGAQGTYSLGGAASRLRAGELRVGDSGLGQFTQDAGTVSTTTLSIGWFTSGSAYDLNGGSLRTGACYVSRSGVGTAAFNHQGGRHSSSVLWVGASGVGEYYLSGSDPEGKDLAVDGTLMLGWWASDRGSFAQASGKVTANTVSIGGRSAAYELTGGQLAANRIMAVGADSALIQSGGAVVLPAVVGAGGTLSVTGDAKYAMSGGSLTAQVVDVGWINDGASVQQSGGVVTTEKLYLAYQSVPGGFYSAGAAGMPTYALTGGELHVTGGQCCYVGYDGQAFFEHTGNADCLVDIDHKLYVGMNAGSHGTYQLAGGQLTVGEQIRVGADGGVGRFYWKNGKSSGGSVDTPAVTFGSKGELAMGYSFSMADLTSGSTTLFDRTTTVTGLGQATLEVTNGATATHAAAGNHTLGGLRVAGGGGAGSGGRYSQQGGTLNAKYVEVNAGGTYEFAGPGRVNITGGGLHVGGTMDFDGRAAAVNVEPNSLVNFATADIQSASYTSLSIGSNTLSIFPSGFDPNTVFASYSNGGDVHTAGTTLTIGSGKRYTFAGTIDDETRFQGGGGLQATADKHVNLGDFSGLSGGGTVDLGQGALTVKRAGGTISGSSSRLFARNAAVTADPSAGASFTQLGGSVNLSEALVLGEGYGQKGLYDLRSGGTLSTGSLFVGYGDVGGAQADRSVFQHQGGNVNVAHDLYLGFKSRSYGEYICYSVTSNLVGGFAVKCATVGAEGTGVFTHKHGTVTINGELVLGESPGSSGTYTVEPNVVAGEGSKLEVDSLIVGDEGNGTLDVQDADLPITVKDTLRFGPHGSLLSVPGTSIRLTGGTFEIGGSDPSQLAGLGNLTLVCAAGTGRTTTFEAAGHDLGNVSEGWTANFALGTLTVGGTVGSARVKLVNDATNSPSSETGEAAYVSQLGINSSSELDLNGLALYAAAPVQSYGRIGLNGGTLGGLAGLTSGGTISGNGTLAGQVTNQALVSPGDSIGTIQVDGEYAQSAAATLRVEVAGLGDDQRDLLDVSGLVTLDGTLDVQTLSGYRPREGDVFAAIFSADPNEVYYSGSFSAFTSNITLGMPEGSSAFDGVTDGGSYSVIFLGYTWGDANGDQYVDGGDLALMGGNWMQSGITWAGADFTGDGLVDGGDLALMGGEWNWSLYSSPPTAVPEPASIVLLALAGVVAAIRRRR